MKATEWLAAIERGEVQHDLNPITISCNGHVGTFRVSTDAVRINGVRHTCCPVAAQQAADALGALLLTSKLYEERWKQATVKIKPALCNVTKDDARVHSRKVDKEIQIATGRLGEWIVADVGKAWIIDPKCTEKKAVNHGWIVPRGDVRFDQRQQKHLYFGVPVSPCLSAQGEYIIQNRGAAHGLYHEDYSQVLLLVDAECEVDGRIMRTADVYKDTELCCLVSFNQMPLQFTRQPGVPLAPSRSEAPRETPPPPSSTQPAPDTEYPVGTLGQRAVDFALNERTKGVREIPDGSNNGPRIKEYLEPCMRDGKGNIGQYLAKTGANWCAAFFWFCQDAVARPGDPGYPYRCSGLESENDAKARGAWRDRAMVLGKKWEPAEGDGVILKRGSQAWQRHVCRYVRRLDERTFETIGGNEGNTIKLTLRRFDDPKLLGFIELPRDETIEQTIVDIQEPLEVSNQLQLAMSIDDQNDGEKAV